MAPLVAVLLGWFSSFRRIQWLAVLPGVCGVLFSVVDFWFTDIIALGGVLRPLHRRPFVEGANRNRNLWWLLPVAATTCLLIAINQPYGVKTEFTDRRRDCLYRCWCFYCTATPASLNVKAFSVLHWPDADVPLVMTFLWWKTGCQLRWWPSPLFELALFSLWWIRFIHSVKVSRVKINMIWKICRLLHENGHAITCWQRGFHIESRAVVVYFHLL